MESTLNAPFQYGGRIRVLAARRGMSVSEYLEKNETEKWCTGHKAWEPRENFGALKSTYDGLAWFCRKWGKERPSRTKPGLHYRELMNGDADGG